MGNYRFREAGGQVLVDDEPLMFYHFSNLTMITPWLYEPGLRHWGHGMDRVLKRHVYLPYTRELKVARALIRAAGGRLPAADSVHQGKERTRPLLRMARQRGFLVVIGPLAIYGESPDGRR